MHILGFLSTFQRQQMIGHDVLWNVKDFGYFWIFSSHNNAINILIP